MTRTAAIIQARLGSVRLPNKVTMSIGNASMLAQVIRRAKQIQGIDEVIVAVPESDAELRAIAIQEGVKTYGGSPYDVLSRYYWVAKWFSVDVVMRLTADCPLWDATLGSDVLTYFRNGRYDYFSNVWDDHMGTTTDGLDTEVFTRHALETAFTLALPGRHREHVTLFIREHPKLFRLGSCTFGAHRGRWSVDTADDLARVREVYARLGSEFSWRDVIALEEKAA